jgi:hypothetical protein
MTVAIRRRPADLIGRLVRVGAMAAFAFALAAGLSQFDASNKCNGGSFSFAFSSGFDVRHCDLVVEKTGREIFRVRLPN